MNPNAQFERDLEQWLQTEAPTSAPAGFHAAVMDRARTLRQRPGWTRTFPARRFGRGRGLTLLAATALLLVGGALAAGSGILRLPTVVPPVPEPSVIAVATPSVRPSLGPPPSDPAGPLAWTPARLAEDWPEPVREEPAGGATVVQIRHRDLTPDAPSDEAHSFEWDQYRDPTGDTGSDDHPWADIRWVEFCGEACLSIGLESDEFFGRGGPPPDVDPSEQWIAYGVVADTDRDGIGDWRYGIDNAFIAEPCGGGNRTWSTDLHTGRTESADGSCPGLPMYGSAGGLRFSSEIAGVGSVGGLPERFYAWASVIVNGRVVATDYAPDVGWLDPSPDAMPLPKPGSTYVLQDPFPVHLSMTVPDGWTDHGRPELTRDGADTNLQFLVVDNPEDPCPDTIEPPLGPSFDDLVSYLEALPRIDISAIRYGTLDGYRSAHLEYRPADGHFECMSGSPIPLEPGNNDAWIIDVDGVRLVIWTTSGSAPTESVRSEVRQIVESIQIVGVSPSLPDSPSPTPSPTPRPTPLPPAAGPVPPNARSWTVTVDNQSSEPAALFVADEDEGGTFRLVGSATPSVVPAGETMTVTFLFPADGGWIYVNPRPGEGGALVSAADIGIPGKILIRAEGDGGWLSP
jgi:hypothetical protein